MIGHCWRNCPIYQEIILSRLKNYNTKVWKKIQQLIEKRLIT